MRFAEFKLFEAEGQPGYYTIGDSHAKGIADGAGKPWVNLAIGGKQANDPGVIGNVSKIPPGSVVLVAAGANDTANSFKAANKDPKRVVPPATIAGRVAALVDAVRARRPSKVILLVFPNGSGRTNGMAQWYNGDYQEQVRSAIKNSVKADDVIDQSDYPISPDNIHLQWNAYGQIGKELVKKFPMGKATSATTGSGDAALPSAAQPLTALSVPTTRREPAIADIQKVLQALAKSQGQPDPLPKFGVDGIRGRETSMAVMQFQKANGLEVDGDPGPETVAKMNLLIKSNPNLVKGITQSTNAEVKPARGSFEKRKVDVSVIQDPDFNKKISKVADALGVDKNDLIAVMRLESGLDPQAQNKNSKATGLIQFMPDTAREVGTSTQELYNMTAVQQLDYVYKYFVMRGVKPGMKLGDLYLAVFWPAAVGQPDGYVIAKRGSKVYDWNSGLDVTKDGVLTAGDARRAVSKYS
jgi:Putative peptidoglycan binding domain/Transglycosylase SLT domain/GDSL-like Lipase/Acylhydrolase family